MDWHMMMAEDIHSSTKAARNANVSFRQRARVELNGAENLRAARAQRKALVRDARVFEH